MADSLTRPALRVFIGAVIAGGLGIIGYAVHLALGAPNPLGWVGLAALCIIASFFPIRVPGVPVYISISDTFFITSALLFGPAPATLTIALDSLLTSLRRGNRVRQVAFNCTSAAVALWCGAAVYFALSGNPPLAQAWKALPMTSVVALGAFAFVYFGINSALTAVAVGLSKSVSIVALWRDHFAILGLNYLAAASVAFFLVALLHSIGPTAFAAVLPLLFICYVAMQSRLGRLDDAQQHVQKLNQLYMSTIGAFSTAIEAKDGVTSDHVHRVQAYALGLARALGIQDPMELQALEAASLLHDTGKLAVPEHILNKPGRLSASELETMRTHVDVGADILSSIDFPYPVVPIVRAHHENWDGTGYPRNLRGEEIPIGARILAVVDCFDALTSDRPYRPAMSEADAIDIIVERRGTMYDPHVVDTFLSVYREIAPAKEQRPALQSALRRIRRSNQPMPPAAAAPMALDTVPGDGSDELLAFVSLARIVAQKATVADIGLVAWGHLRYLAPGASLVLFAVDGPHGALVAQTAAGPAAERLRGASMHVGQRVSGWVAANRQPMINADAQLDLDDAGELRFATALPLVANSRLLAVMTLYADEPFADVQVRRLEMVVPQLASSLAAAEHARAHPASSTLDLRVVSRR